LQQGYFVHRGGSDAMLHTGDLNDLAGDLAGDLAADNGKWYRSVHRCKYRSWFEARRTRTHELADVMSTRGQ
jgi:hypothetical protein